LLFFNYTYNIKMQKNNIPQKRMNKKLYVTEKG